MIWKFGRLNLGFFNSIALVVSPPNEAYNTYERVRQGEHIKNAGIETFAGSSTIFKIGLG